MKKWEKLVVILLAVILVMSLGACAGKENNSAKELIRIVTKPMTEQYIWEKC